MKSIKVAAIQMACTSDKTRNIEMAKTLVREAAAQDAQIILLQELFETLYFCQEESPEHFGLATELPDPSYDSKDHWQTCMCGHSAANLMPVVAANRIRTETVGPSKITFYGSSFITDNKGRIIAQADRSTQGLIVADMDLERFARDRESWGLFRDRRPELYGPIMTLDGITRVPH